MRVDDVEPLVAHDAAQPAQCAGGEGESRSWRERRSDAVHGNAIDDRRPARRRHDARIDVGCAQRQREIAQMELDPPWRGRNQSQTRATRTT